MSKICGSRQQRPPCMNNHTPTPFHISLVIARYEENVLWLREVVHTLAATLAPRPVQIMLYIYEKGSRSMDVTLDDLFPDGAHTSHACVSLCSTHLPNVGRESHSYLEHVIRTRSKTKTVTEGTRDDITVFLQGSMRDHVPHTQPSLPEFVTAMVMEAIGSPLGESGNHACHTHFSMFNACPGMRAAMYSVVGDCGQDFGSWFVCHIGPWIWKTVSEGPSWWQNGIFAVQTVRFWSRDERVKGPAINQNLDKYFSMLHSEVNWHINPEQGHYFERSWCHVFPPLL